MNIGKTLKIFVMGSDPKSLKTVELVNWTGQAFIGGREHMNQIRDRKELSEHEDCVWRKNDVFQCVA